LASVHGSCCIFWPQCLPPFGIVIIIFTEREASIPKILKFVHSPE
jgi:hypothetical protein